MFSNENSQNTSSSFDYDPPRESPLKRIIIIGLIIVVILLIAGYLAFNKGPYFWESKKAPVEAVTAVDSTADSKHEIYDVKTPELVNQNTNENNKFHIIAGAFIVDKNASAYMDELRKKGYEPKIILKRNNYSFISIFSYPTFKEANSKYHSLQKDEIPIWIMKY